MKVGTLGGHNLLCLKSFIIRNTNKNFKNQNLLALQGLSSMVSEKSIRVNDITNIFGKISLCEIEQW